MFHRFFRHIKEGFIGVKRHFAMAVSSASAVLITLLLVGVFGVLAVNMAYLTKEIEANISLVALIDYDVKAPTITVMKQNVEKLDGVDKVEYRTKDQEFDFYCENYPDMVEFSELYRQDNPFHDTFIITFKDGANMSEAKTKIQKMEGISSVEDGGSNTYTLINVLRSVRTAGAILIGALVFLATYLIFNTIKITISARKNEIWIMRNVGARNGYIRAPFLVEGVIIGIMGSLIPIGVIAFAYIKLYDMTGGILAGVMKLVPALPFTIYLGLALLIIGVIVGFIGSYISVCKYLRVTR